MVDSEQLLPALHCSSHPCLSPFNIRAANMGINWVLLCCHCFFFLFFFLCVFVDWATCCMQVCDGDGSEARRTFVCRGIRDIHDAWTPQVPGQFPQGGSGGNLGKGMCCGGSLWQSTVRLLGCGDGWLVCLFVCWLAGWLAGWCACWLACWFGLSLTAHNTTCAGSHVRSELQHLPAVCHGPRPDSLSDHRPQVRERERQRERRGRGGVV